MEHTEMHHVICVLDRPDAVLEIPLDEMLKRLYINTPEELIHYFVEKRYRVRFRLSRNIKRYSFGVSGVKSLTDYLNKYRSDLYSRMSDEELEKNLANYGNDFTRQVRTTYNE